MVLVAALPAVSGAVQVYIVVASVELFDLGTGGVGLLNSAIGVGAFVGAVAALSLTGVRRLSPAYMAGVVTWGFPLALLGIWPEAALAVVLFGVIGFGNSIAMVAGMTLVQRTVADEVMARVFGVVQMLVMVFMGIGAALAPALISALGIEGALIATGLFLPALVLVLGTSVARIDATARTPSEEELRILTSVPIFTPLPGTSLEQLATRLVPLRVDAGSVIIREGDEGDSCYLLVKGEVRVTLEAKELARIEPGGCFGEMVYFAKTNPRRTTTITAAGEVTVIEIKAAALRAATDALQAGFNKAVTRVLIQRLMQTNRLLAQVRP
jgi:MFS family permease